MATQRALFLKVKALEMLRNTFGEGSPRQELAGTLAQQRAQRICVQPGDPILRDTAGAKNSAGRAQTFMHIDCGDARAQGFLCLMSHLWRHQFKLLFCYCTMIILRIQTSETLLWGSLD